MDDQIEARVKRVICEYFGVAEEKVVPTASIVHDLDADSLDRVEVIMALEEEFSCDIADEEAEKAESVQQIVDLIRAKNAKAAAA